MTDEEKKARREEARQARREERERKRKEKQEAKKKEREALKEKIKKKKGGWFQKIPTDVLLSPGGIILIFFALIMELLDLIPAFFIVELLLEVGFIVMLKLIVKDMSLKAMVISFGIERLDFLGILPTWALKMFGFF